MKKNIYILIFLVLASIYSVFAASFYEGDDLCTESLLMVNTDTEMIVFEKNSHIRRSMASLTKIMTYIITAENIKNMDSDVVLINENIWNVLDNESSMSNIRVGDKLSVLDLLNCLMIPSGNDAAQVLANYVGGGSIDKFIDMMNKKAQDLGCYDTHFTNPHGLYDPNHYSTVYDMYIIAKYAMNLPYFMDIIGKTEYKLFNDDRPILRTSNKLINPSEPDYYYPYASGIKTGWHSDAGRCIISSATKNGVTYICSALGAPNFDKDGNKIDKNFAILESIKLYKWAFDNLAIKTLADKHTPMGQTKLGLAWRKDKLLLNPESDLKLVIPKDAEISNIDVKLSVPESIDAPVEMGDLIGNAVLFYKGQKIAETELVAGETVSKSVLLFAIRTISEIFMSKVLLMSICLIIFLIVFYILITVIKNRGKRIGRYRKT